MCPSLCRIVMPTRGYKTTASHVNLLYSLVSGVCDRCLCFGTDNDKLLTAWPKVTIIMRLVLLLA